MDSVARTSTITVLGELLLTVGLGALLFAGYEVWVTDWESARAQAQAAGALDAEWAGGRSGSPTGAAVAPVPGRPFLKIYIPDFGDGWARTVLEGVDQQTLGAGPGHYPDSALPGQPGNVAIAGHRVGRGAPFDAAGQLRSCDAIVLETRDTWFVYRMLPMAGERGDWPARSVLRTRCQGVAPLTGSYGATVGSEVVPPAASEVIAPVPHRAGAAPTTSLLTLTTCHPRFSARERLVLHAVQVGRYAKLGRGSGWRPSELAEV